MLKQQLHERSQEDRRRPDLDHLLSDQIKWIVVHLKLQGMSDKDTAQIVGLEYNRPTLSRQTVKAIYKKYHETQGVSNQWSTQGRPFSLNEEDLKKLVKYFQKNPKNSVQEAKNTLNLPASRQTINRVLLHQGLKAYRAPKKFFISAKNVAKRLQFALDCRNLTLNYWKKVTFSDESGFTLYNANGRLLVRRTHKSYSQESLQIDGQSDTLLVWGIISWYGIGPLVRVDRLEEGKKTLNGERYLTILKRYLLRNYSDLASQKLVFQQDNAPPHRCDIVKSWIEGKDIKQITWPPQSPDMNIIEHIWNELKFRLRGRVYKDREKLWKDLQREWKLISRQFIRDLYDSLPRRIAALRDAQGNHTKY